MKTIFSELYNKILELFQIEKSENTGECAANRLQVILMHDRTKLDPLIMGRMRCELIEVFSKYVVIDKEKLEIDLKNEGDAAALMLNIPIVRAKTEEELEELRKELQKSEEQETKDGNTENNGAENNNINAVSENAESAETENINPEFNSGALQNSAEAEQGASGQEINNSCGGAEEADIQPVQPAEVQ